MLLPQRVILYTIIEVCVKGVLPLKYGVLYAKISRMKNNEIWISMTDMRNETAQAYNELFAEKVLLELPKVQVALEQLLWKLKQ